MARRSRPGTLAAAAGRGRGGDGAGAAASGGAGDLAPGPSPREHILGHIFWWNANDKAGQEREGLRENGTE